MHDDFGGDAALARLRGRLARRGLRLVLDFVPNHMAPDHPWVNEHPDFFVSGTEEQLAAQPRNYCRVDTSQGPRVLAFGRDPYFDGWPDTLQLNYGNPALQEAMLGELRRIARQCDGVRCDMAMLVLPEVFERTWGISAPAFWPRATDAVRTEIPGFLFLAEVYWDLEWTLQQQGFDYTYDKRLYDRLEKGQHGPVRDHLSRGPRLPGPLGALPREPRRATGGRHVLTRSAPGGRHPHLPGAGPALLPPGPARREAHAHPRAPRPRTGRGLRAGIAAFYDGLLECLKDPAFRDGGWQLLECRPAWDGNGTWDSFVAFSWTGPGEARRLVAVNYAPHQGQCYVALPWPDLDGRTWRLQDLMGTAVYDRAGDDLARQGLYLDMPAWGHHVFAVSPAG